MPPFPDYNTGPPRAWELFYCMASLVFRFLGPRSLYCKLCVQTDSLPLSPERLFGGFVAMELRTITFCEAILYREDLPHLGSQLLKLWGSLAKPLKLRFPFTVVRITLLCRWYGIS